VRHRVIRIATVAQNEKGGSKDRAANDRAIACDYAVVGKTS